MVIGIDTDGCITDVKDMGTNVFSKVYYMLNAQPRVGCKMALQHFKDHKRTLINITGRQYGSENTLRGRLMRHFTHKWYNRVALEFDEVLFCSRFLRQSKLKHCREQGVDIMLEDNPDTIMYLRKHGIYTVIFDAKNNRRLPGPRVKSWTEFAIMISEMEMSLNGVASVDK